MQYDIKSMVKDGKKARFIYYRHNELWYETECGFQFAVPVEDIGEATFLAEDKAMMLMRYIRKQVAANEAGKMESIAHDLANQTIQLGLNENGIGAVPNCC